MQRFPEEYDSGSPEYASSDAAFSTGREFASSGESAVFDV
jgi:hypothetical protein